MTQAAREDERCPCALLVWMLVSVRAAFKRARPPSAKELPREQTILVNLSGRGDKDIDYVIEHFGHRYGITATPQAFTETPLAAASGAKRRACEEGDAEMPTANAAGA